MDCEEIKKIIPKYFNHTASEEDIKKVEEHLCVCHDCRTALGELMDQSAEAQQPTKPEPAKEGLGISSSDDLEPLNERERKIEYFPGGDLGVSSDEPKEAEEEPEETQEPSREPVLPEPEALKETEKIQESQASEEKLPAEETELSMPEAKENLAEEKTESPAESQSEPAVKDAGFNIAEDLEGLPEEEAKEPDKPDSGFSLDDVPLEENKAGLLEYIVLAVGLVVFGVFLFLVMRIKG